MITTNLRYFTFRERETESENIVYLLQLTVHVMFCFFIGLDKKHENIISWFSRKLSYGALTSQMIHGELTAHKNIISDF